MDSSNKEMLIRADGLTLAYDGYVAAKDVSFSLPHGDYLCVVGENGSGKSTLMKAIIGELRPAAGELELAPCLKTSGIGYLPQQSKIQRDFPASAEEVVRSGCIRRDHRGLFWSGESKKAAWNAMELLKITDLAKKSFGELSGGQRQRVLLARAVCASRHLLLLDEPVTGLDPDAAHEMYAAIRDINRECGCGVMMVSHDIQCALREANHVLSLCRGHSFFGTVAEYAVHERLDGDADAKRHASCHSHDHSHSHNSEHPGGTPCC